MDPKLQDHPLRPYPKLIINCALTGMVPTKEDTPHVPTSPEEVAADAIKCAEAGASMLHIHARDENGRPRLDRRGMPVHTVNDHWFVLNVKFVWVDAPESVKAKAPELPSFMRGRTTMGGTAAPQSSPSSGRSNVTTGME